MAPIMDIVPRAKGIVMKKTVPSQNPTSIQQELLRALRYHRPLSLISISTEVATSPSMMAASTRFSDILRRHLRNTDILSEESGTQSYLLLPETPLEGALIVGNRLSRDLIQGAGPFENPTIGISAIADGIYRADDLIHTAIMANRAARAAGYPLFTISTFRDKTLSLPFLVAVILNLSQDDTRHLSSFLERSRREPEKLRETAAALGSRLANRLKIPAENHDVISFWILFHDLLSGTSGPDSLEEKMPAMSRRKKILHAAILRQAPGTGSPEPGADPRTRGMLEIFHAVLIELGSFSNPTEEVVSDLLKTVLARIERRGNADKQTVTAFQKTQPRDWIPFPT